MYSKTEVCFTIIVATAASLYFSSSQPTADLAGAREQTITTVDGGHPPPPIPPLTGTQLNGTEFFISDGGHPPPPIPPLTGTQLNGTEFFISDGGHPPPPIPPPSFGASLGSTDVLLADGGHPPPPPPPSRFHRTEMLQANGRNPLQPARLFAGLG